MSKPTQLRNQTHAFIFLKICSLREASYGELLDSLKERKQQEIEMIKKRKKSALAKTMQKQLGRRLQACERELKRITLGELRNKLRFLVKDLGIVEANLKRLGRGNGTRAKFKPCYPGILRFMDQKLGPEVHHGQEAVSQNYPMYSDPKLIRLLDAYLNDCQNGLGLPSLHDLFLEFMIGIGRCRQLVETEASFSCNFDQVPPFVQFVRHCELVWGYIEIETYPNSKVAEIALEKII